MAKPHARIIMQPVLTHPKATLYPPIIANLYFPQDTRSKLLSTSLPSTSSEPLSLPLSLPLPFTDSKRYCAKTTLYKPDATAIDPRTLQGVQVVNGDLIDSHSYSFVFDTLRICVTGEYVLSVECLEIDDLGICSVVAHAWTQRIHVKAV